MNPTELDDLVRPLTIKDLRVQTRVRGLSPAGGIDTLRQRLKEAMQETGDFALKTETGEDQVHVQVVAGQVSKDEKACNNYSRPGGLQNVGNFLTDRPSSRVLAAPGGASQIVFGECDAPAAGARKHEPTCNPITGAVQSSGTGTFNNNYSRPGGQNVGNFLTDKPSSRVLAAPGGKSQIVLG